MYGDDTELLEGEGDGMWANVLIGGGGEDRNGYSVEADLLLCLRLCVNRRTCEKII